MLKSVLKRFQEKLVCCGWGTTMTFSKAGKGNPHYLSVVSKKQNKTTTKNLMIFCRKTISTTVIKNYCKKWRPIWSNAKCFHYMVHMDQQTCSLLFITENLKFFRCKNITLQWKPFCYISIKVWQPITQKRANMLLNIWVRSMQLGF